MRRSLLVCCVASLELERGRAMANDRVLIDRVRRIGAELTEERRLVRERDVMTVEDVLDVYEECTNDHHGALLAVARETERRTEARVRERLEAVPVEELEASLFAAWNRAI